MELKLCVVCGAVTRNVFNIRFNPTPICEACANSIMLQQVAYLTNKHEPKGTNDT